MIGERSRLTQSALFAADLAVVAAAWLVAYPIRFNLLPLYVPHVPPFGMYAWLAALAVLVWAVVLRLRPLVGERNGAYGRLMPFLQQHALAAIAFVVLTFFVSEYKPSRVVIAIFLTISTAVMVGARLLLRRVQRAQFRAGKGVTRCLVAGTGNAARTLVARLHAQPELGEKAVGFLTDQPAEVGTALDGLPVLGLVENVQATVQAQLARRVYVALPLSKHDLLQKVLDNLGEELVDVKVVVDLMDFVVLRSAVEDFAGLPIVSLKQTPMSGWGAAAKRAFDIVFAGAALVCGSPVLGAIAAAIKLDSPGPVLYRQTRMGLDGKVFDICKFRSMRADAETATGAVWAVADDPRRTRLGAFLRRTNLDELPQFWNVLRGDMSVVGPRPERPVFIDEFRTEIPKYMLRHKVKAGLTGWAQVNGWRGNTDLRHRIECDLYYIENWSFWLDLRIIWMTIFSRKARENAY